MDITTTILPKHAFPMSLDRTKVTQKLKISAPLCSDSIWLSHKIHVSKVEIEKTKCRRLSAFQNIKNFKNRSNSEKVTVSESWPFRCIYKSNLGGGEWTRSLKGGFSLL